MLFTKVFQNWPPTTFQKEINDEPINVITDETLLMILFHNRFLPFNLRFTHKNALTGTLTQSNYANALLITPIIRAQSLKNNGPISNKLSKIQRNIFSTNWIPNKFFLMLSHFISQNIWLLYRKHLLWWYVCQMDRNTQWRIMKNLSDWQKTA